MKVSIFGRGSVGTKLTNLFAEAGYDVAVCAREASEGVLNFKDGATIADMIVVAIPYVAAESVLSSLKEELKSKVVIDATNPLNDDWSPLLLGQETSAGEEIAKLVPNSFVVKAFNTIFADVMSKECHDRDGQKITAFIAGDDEEAKNKVLEVAERMGFSPLNVGPITMSRYLEAMAHLNINIAVGQGGGTSAAFVYHQTK